MLRYIWFITAVAFVLVAECCTPDSVERRVPGNDVKPGETHMELRSIPTYVRRLSPGYMFGVMDEDSNDFIDAIEWMNAGLTKKPRAFVSLLDKIDADKDEMISFEEFKDWHTRWSNGELGKGGKQGQDIQD